MTNFSKYFCGNSPFNQEDKKYIPISKVGTDRKSQAKLRAKNAGLSEEESKSYVKEY